MYFTCIEILKKGRNNGRNTSIFSNRKIRYTNFCFYHNFHYWDMVRPWLAIFVLIDFVVVTMLFILFMLML